MPWKGLAVKERKAPEVGRGEAANDTVDLLALAALKLTDAMELLACVELAAEVKPPDVRSGIDFYQEVTRFEITLIKEALRFSKGNQAVAAKLLRMNHTTLNCKIKQYKINPKLGLVNV